MADNAPAMVAGIHLDKAVARLVWGGPNEPDSGFYCDGWRRFSSRLAFQRHWNRHLRTFSPRVAVTGYFDPLGIVPWLDRQGLCIEFPETTYGDVEGQMVMWGIPGAYARAFDVALSANLRAQHHHVLADRWLELQVLHRTLARVTDDLRRLSSNMAGIPPTRSLPPPVTPLDDLPPYVDDPVPF